MESHIENELKTVGERISFVVKESGINSRAFAIKAGIDTSQFGKITKDKLGISYETAKKITDKFSVNTEWIMDGTGEIWNNVPRENMKHSADSSKQEDNITTLIRANAAQSMALQEVTLANRILSEKVTVDALTGSGLAASAIVNTVLESIALAGVPKLWASVELGRKELYKSLSEEQMAAIEGNNAPE